MARRPRRKRTVSGHRGFKNLAKAMRLAAEAARSIQVTAELDDRQAQAGYDRMLSATQKLTQFYSAMKRPVRADIRDHGDKAVGPDSAWKNRQAEVSFMGFKKRKRSKRTLGKLTRSMRLKVRRSGLWIDTPIPWGHIHQVGGVAGHGARIPARPFIYLSDQVMDLANKTFKNYVLSQWPKGSRLRFVRL